MKKYIQTILFLAFIVSAKANIVVVTAHLKDLTAGKWIFYREQNGNNVIDSVKSIAGGFTIKIDIATGKGDLYLFSVERHYDDPNSFTEIFLDKGNVTITGNGPLFKDAKLSGSAAATEMNAYNNYLLSNEDIKNETTLYREARDYYHSNDTANLNAIEKRIDAIDSIKAAMQQQWVLKHPASPISAYVLSNMRYTANMDSIAAWYGHLTAAAKDNIPSETLKHAIEINRLTGIGKPAIEFTQTDTAGVPVSLNSFRGKYVLLDFWASWCGPCREENPNVVAAFNKYKDKNFTVLSVSLDQPTGKEKWMAAIHHDSLAWTHVSDLQFWNNAVARQYDIESIPSNFLLDPNGVIIGKNLRGEDLNNKLHRLLE